MGGTSSSKTFSELQLLQIIAEKRQKRPVSISVVSESIPHLKLGAIRDFEKILKARNLYDERNINFTDRIYTFGNSFIEFFAADEGKATGPRRDILLLNEVNNIPLNVVKELSRRTNETIFYDFNPTSEFWITDEVLNLPENEVKLIKSNYLDNCFLPDSIKRDIELEASRNPNFKRVHVDVEWGTTDGLIFEHFTLVDSMPDTDKRRIGVDFGFSNDPTAIVDLRQSDGKWWIDEICYRKGMHNSDISAVLQSLNLPSGVKTIADSAEPKSVSELSLMGNKVEGAVKGADSIRSGIATLQSMPIMVTKRSVNLIKELRGYQWDKERDGTTSNAPAKSADHAIDAARYAASDLTLNKPLKSLRYSFG